MKKIILLLVALLSLSMDSLAQEFTEIQKKLPVGGINLS